jgi:hypothetical protein
MTKISPHLWYTDKADKGVEFSGRDLLLRSAGPTASRRQRALILPRDPGAIASPR